MSFRCERCPKRGRCAQCQKRNAKGEVRRRARLRAVKIIELATRGVSPAEDVWLLTPDDGVVDRIAVSVAVYGERRVRLTYRERVFAATTALRHGVNVATLCLRLALPYVVSEDLICRRKLPPQTGGSTAA